MPPFARYLAFQVPGWLLVAGLLVFLWPSSGLPSIVGAGVLALWVAKDLVLYPLVKVGYTRAPTGTEALLGREGVTRGALDPAGQVQVAGTLWRAEARAGEAPIAAGTPVRVCATRGLTLVVTRAEG